MQTEEDKYVLIQDYLSGKLSGASLVEFESRMRLDSSFLEEVGMHRMANEAVTDFYLLKVKDSVKKVVKQKASQSRWIKWGTGLGFFVLSMSLLYTFYPQERVTDDPLVRVNDEIPILAKEASKAIVAQSKSTHRSISHISTSEKRAIKKRKGEAHVKSAMVEEEQLSVVPLKPIVAEQKNVPIQLKKEDQTVTSTSETPTKSAEAPLMDDLGKKEAYTVPQISPQSIDLVFNPSIGEEASFPLDETYNGELLVFDASGTIVFRCIVQNGYPNRWDGRLTTGGFAVSGQYGFVIKDTSGKEILHGFITVAR